MKIKYYLIIAALPLMQLTVSAQTGTGNFPFFRSFLDGRMDNIEKPEPNNPKAKRDVDRSNKAKLVNELGLQLTSKKSEVGAFYLPNHPFSTSDGLKIEFEYMMYPSPGSTVGLTDGITMFLIDAKKKNELEFGAEGAGFGYTHRWTIKDFRSERIKGVPGGYLAIALDQKHFKVLRMEGDELRNGIPYYNRNITSNAKDPIYNTASNITIRGAAGYYTRTEYSGTLSYVLDDREWGYPVLATRNTNTSSMVNNAAFVLDTKSGNYNPRSSSNNNLLFPAIPKAFDIAGNSKFNSPDETAYRKAVILLEANSNSSVGGFKISVAIQHGNDLTTVIENFTFPATITYLENGLPSSVDKYMQPTVPLNPPVITYTVNTPEQLVIGFTASTGTDLSYTNVIKNLRITPLYGANTAHDDIKSHRRGPVVIRPLDNDLGYYNEGNSTPIGDKEFLDPSSFRFWKNEYECLGSNVFEHTVPGEGRWIYNEGTKELMFFPEKGYKGKATVIYDIKGLHYPYNQEKFRSSQATVSVTIDDNQP